MSFFSWLRKSPIFNKSAERKPIVRKTPIERWLTPRTELLEDRLAPAVRAWDGGGGDANWATAANWDLDVAPLAGDDLVFPGGAAQLTNVNNLPAGTTFNTILIQGSGYAVSGNAIRLAGGLTANHASGTSTFGLDTTILNALTFVTANPAATLNVTAPIHTGNLIGTTFLFGTTALNFDGAGTTSVSGAIDGAASITKWGGGTLALSGANDYDGITDVRQGVVVAASNLALGKVVGDTQIQAGAALHISGNVTIGEHLALREGGVGFGNGTDTSTLGGLRSTAGTNTLTGNIDLAGGNNLIGVNAGSTLIHTGIVANALGSTNRLIKTGDGTLRLAGTQDNIYRGETRVLKGTLELGKTAGKNAVGGNLIIGDNIGGDTGATVRLLASNQIPQLDFFGVALNTVQLESSGLLDFNGFSDVVGNLTLRTGTNYSSDVSTGAGTLTLSGTLLVQTFQGSSGLTPAATISGNLDIGTHFSGGGGGTGIGSSRRFAIQDTQNQNIATDLIISANITGAADVTLIHTDNGTVRYTGNNAGLLSPYIVQGTSAIEIGANNALGAGLFSPQNNSVVLVGVGGPWTLGNTVALDSNVNFLGTNLTFTGAVTLSGDRTLLTMDPAQTVTFAGPIGEGIFANRTLNKSGRGTIEFTAANTYSGTTTINNDGGTLVLRGAGSLLNVNSITVGVGSTLRVDNNNGGNLTDRLNDATQININGKLVYVGSSTANSSEYFGTLNPGGSFAPTIELQNTSGGAFSSVVTSNALAVGTDRVLNFLGTGVPLSATGPNRISFENNPGNLDDGVLNGSRVTFGSTVDFATFDSSLEGTAVVAFPSTGYITDINQAGATSNVRLTTPGVYTLTTSKSINSLVLGPGVTLAGPGATLTINSSNLHFVGAGAATLSVENLNTNGGSIFVDAGMTATISSNIFSGNVQKGGAGKLILSGDNQTAGAINVNEGTLNVQRSTALGSPAGTTTVRTNATLEIEQTTFGPIDMGLEPINNDGGTGVPSGMLGVGALRNVAGNNRIAGNVTVSGPVVNFLGLYGGFGNVLVAVGAPIVDVATGTTLTLTGDFGGSGELAKIGGGTLELAGVVSRGQDRTTRIFEGTVLLNNEPGVQASRGRFLIGTDVPGAPAATLRLGGSDQIIDDRRVEVFASGLFDLNGNSEVIAEGNLILHVGPSGAGDVVIGAGGTLTTNADIQVHNYGVGNPTGATITGGTLALQVPGTIAGAGARNWQINDGAVGTDLTITSAIVDGTGLQSVGINKNGFGTLELGGTTANTFTGTTAINEGTVVLNKTAGTNAVAGPVTIGNNDPTSGFASSDVLRLAQPNQIPDYLALITVTTTGLFDLNGMNETIGVADAQTALSLQASATVNVGAGATLSIIGNIAASAANGAALWTPVVAPRILGGTLDLGAVQRTIDQAGDRSELPYELQITSNLAGSAGFQMTNSGTLLLEGTASTLTGDIFRANGNFAVGSDAAFGSARVLMNGGALLTFGGKRTLANEFLFSPTTISFVGGNNFGGPGALGGGGNDLTFAGIVDVVAGTWSPSIAVASQVDFAGGLGETYGGVFFRKQGAGTMIFSSVTTLSGNLEIGQGADNGAGFGRLNGGAVVLRDAGTLLNSNVLIGYGGTLQIDNSGTVLADRLADNVLVDMSGGTLALVGKSGAATTEAFGQLRLRNNDATSFVHAILPAGAISATWRFASYGIETANESATLQFVGRGADITAAGPNRIGFIVAPGLADGIIPTAVLSGPAGFDFATVTNATPTTTPADNFLGALTSGPNFATTLAGATSTVNVKLTGSEAVGGTVTANALLLANGGIVVSGAGSLNLDSGLLASRGAGNTVSVANLTLGTTEGIVYVDGGSTLNVSGGISATGATASLGKAGLGTLTLSGNNAFLGTTRITGGTLVAANNNAFGGTTNGVIVTYGATLELASVNIPAETLELGGFGEGILAAVSLRSVGGVSTWQGNVNLPHNRTAIEAALGSTLVIGSAATTGAVTGSAMNKIGAGTLQFAGTANNTFNATSIVWQGTLELNKTVGVNAIPVMADNNEFFVGNFYGADNSVTLRSLANDQIGDGPYRLRIMPSGVFDLNGRTETIVGRIGGGNNHDVLGLDIGSSGGGDVVLGGGTLRIANDTAENGRVQIRVIAGGVAVPATISGGTLQFGGTVAQNARILVDDSSAVEDIIVSATIANGGVAPLNFIKNNNGRMVLSGNNTYTAPTLIEQGELVVRHVNALGATAAGTTVNAGLTLLIDGVSLSEPLSLNGTGFGGQGAIRNVSGSNTLSGAVSLPGIANIGVDAGTTLDISSVISGGGGVNKLLPGTLRYSGTSANIYTGLTQVSEGALELNKTAGLNAVVGLLTVGNDNGVTGADLVRLLASNQIGDGAEVRVTAAGQLDLNGFNETLGNATQTGLNFFLASTTNPLVTTGAGTLTLAPNVGIQAQGVGGNPNPVLTTPGNVGARIVGNLNLGGGAHSINAGDVGAMVRELQIDALVSNGSLSSIGGGLVYMTNAGNSYAGGTAITAGGGVIVGASNALGTGTISLGTNANNTVQIFASNFTGGAPATITLPNAILLNTVAANATVLNLRGDDNLVLSGPLTNNLNNNTIQAIMEAGATLTLSGTINLSNDATSRTLTFNNTTFGGGVRNGVVGGDTTISGQIVNGGGSTASNLTKSGVGLVVVSNNTSSFAGITTVAQGVLLATANNALGASGSLTTNHTIVNNGATLAVAAGVTLPEWIVANNNGLGNFGSIRLMDVVPGTTETATISGNVNFNATTFVGVDGGGASPDRLVFNGTLASGGGQMNKVGLGEMEVAGGSDNGVTFTGAPSPWDDGLLVRAGSLLFNKTGTSRAIAGGTISIGDHGGPANSDRLILIGSGTDQIGGNLNLDIGASGQLLFAGATVSEQINQLQIFRLGSIAGSVDTTGAGTLVLTANIFASNAGVTTGATPAAVVAGNVNLNGGRNVNASDTFIFDPAEDLVVSALLSNGSINVNGDGGRTGTVAVTNPGNSYAGGTTITGQTLDNNQSFVNGLNFVVDGTLVVRNGGVLGTGNVTVNAGATLVLDNTAANANRIADGATVTLQGGHLRLVGNAGGSTEQIATLTFNSGSNVGQDNRVTIDSSAGGVTELLAATSLTRGGSGTAHFVGVGSDLGNATNSRIQVTGGASPFVNGVLPWATMSGPAGFDLVTDADGSPAAAPYFLGRVTAYNASVNAGGIVRLNGGTDTLTADRTVDALLLENGATVNGPFMLTIGTATSGLVATRTGGNAIAATGSAGNPGLQFAGREPLFLVESGASLNVSSTINSTATLWKDRPGSLTLSGDNDVAVGQQLTGAITVNAGTLTVTHEDALGAEPGGTVTVNRRAALILDATAGGLNVGNKAFNIQGLGVNDDGTGALRTLGANLIVIGTGATAVTWNAVNPTVVSVGAGNVLNLNAAIGGGAQLLKRGAGELIYSGATANSNTQSVFANEGTFSLGKINGAILAIGGALTINDLGNYDPVGTAVVRYLTPPIPATPSTNMIGDVVVTVNPQGTLDFNGVSDTIANTLIVNGGAVQNSVAGGTFQFNALIMTGGTVNTGSGTLNLNGNLTYNVGLNPTGVSPTIDGNLNLVGGTRTITVNDGYFAHNDLTINALISNGRILKNGGGGLFLTNGGNTFLAGINEVQRVAIAGATAGTSQFNINFNGNVTGPITVNVSDATTAGLIDAALELLPNVGPGGVNVTVAGVGLFNIEFTGHLAEQDVPNQIATNVVVSPGTFTPSTITAGLSGVSHQGGILAFNNDTALGTARVQIVNAQFLPIGDRTIANNLVLINNQTDTFGGRRDFGGTSDLTVTGGVTLHSATSGGQVINLDVNDPQTEVTFAGVVSGGGNFIVPTKRGIGRLTLSGNNTFDVRDTVTGVGGGTGQTDGIRVEGGTLRVAHSNALGTSGTANVHIRADFTLGAVLEIDGSGGAVNLPAGRSIVPIYADNYVSWGLFGRASAATGVIRSLAGANSIAGILDLRNIGDNDNIGRVYVGVDVGSLALAGTIFGTRNNANSDIRNNRDLLKVGAGTLEFAGSNPNFITNNLAVLEGAVSLNKAPGVPAHSGTVIVGDNIGAANSDVLILAASEQILDAAAVVVAGTGQVQTNASHAASLTNEVQQIQVGNAAPAGQFRLQFNGATTGDIAFGATLASIQAALNALPTIGGVGGSVVVLGAPPAQNTAFTVTFLGTLAGANQPQIKIINGTTAYSGATLAVTTLTPGGLAGRETVGAVTLRMAPQATGNIALNAGSTLALNADLTVDNYGALPLAAPTTATIAGGFLDLNRTSSPGTVSRNFNVTADGPGADDLVVTSTIRDGAVAGMSNLVKNTGAASRMVLSGPSANQHTGTTVANTGALQIEKAGALGSTLPDEVQNFVVNNALGAATGQYFLTFNAVNTANLDVNATADEVQTALNALATIGGVGGSVQVVSVINGNTNVQYFIRFGGTLAATDVAQITTNTGSLGGGASIGAGATSQGGGLLNIGAAQTTVNGGGSLELDNAGTIVNEQLTLNGAGILNSFVPAVFNNGAQAVSGTGALRNLAGNNVWEGTVAGLGNVTINNNPTAIGANPGTTLTLGSTTGVNVVNGGGSLLKVGAGTLEFGGVNSNTYGGNTYVDEGTLRLNKQGTAVAIDNGEVMVGDNVGADNADVLLYAATAGTNQLGDQTVRIARTGFVNLNGVSDTNNASFVLEVGQTTSGDIATGGGVLTSNSTLFAFSQAGGTALTPAATVTGIYDLNGATRNFDVREGGAPVELDVQGVVQGTGGINKLSQGRLRLSGNNTYTGAVAVNNGVLEVGSNGALGTAAGGVTVSNNSALEFKSASPLAIPETAFTIAGDGWDNSGTGALANVGTGNVSLVGTITINAASYLATTTIANQTAATTLSLGGNVTINAGNLVLTGPGDIVVPSNVSTGTTFISSPYFSSLQGRLFLATGLGVNNTTGGAGQGVNNLVPGTAPITAPNATGNLVGALNFPQDSDAAFTTFFGGTPGGAAFSAAFWGNLVVPTTGTYYLAISNNDDTAALWIDDGNGGGIAGNNNFEAGELRQSVGCCNNNGFVTATLTAGTYKIAFVVEDTGGGSGLTGRFQPGAFGVPANAVSMPIVSTIPIASAAVIKRGTGTATLSGANNYGATTVDAGTLVANGAASALGSTTATVNSTATLAGTGTILSTVTVNSGGTLAPATVGTAGTLTVNNNVTFDNGSIFNVDILSAASADRLTVGGTGVVTVNAGALINGNTAYLPVNGTDQFVVVNKTSAGAIVGTFTSQTLPPPPATSPPTVVIGAKTYTTNYAAAAPAPADGNDLVLIAAAATRVWDGAPSTTNNWSDAGNWVGDGVPFAGDSIVFNDVGVGVRPNPVNDLAGPFNSVTLANTTGSYSISGAAINVTAGLVDTSTTLTGNTISAALTGATATVSKTGSSTLALAGTQPYAGTTTVSAGTLNVTGTLSATSAVSVNGGTLGGTGSINTAALVSVTSGAIDPGVTTGTLSTGSVTFSAAASFNVTLASASLFDQLSVTGVPTLGGATLNLNVAYVPGPADAFVLIANDGVDPVVGTFAGLANGATVGLSGFKIFYNGGDGNDVMLLPASVSGTYVDDAWTGFTFLQSILDADPETAGSQVAFFGYNAFSNVSSAIATMIPTGTVSVNDGNYATDAATLGAAQTMVILGQSPVLASSVTLGSLAGGGTVQTALAALANTLTIGSLGTNTTYSGTITGPGSLTKVGGGTLALTNGASSFSGPVTVSGGTLSASVVANAGSNSSIGSGSAITVNAGTFDFAGGGLGTTNRPVTLTNAASAIGVSLAAGNLTLTTGLAGAGNLTKVGPGTLTLNANSAYAGSTTITGGTLHVTSGDGAPNGSTLLIGAAGTLSLGAAETVGPITLQTGTSDGADIVLGANTLTLLTDPVVVSTGTGAVGATITGIGGSSLNLNGAAPRTFTVANGAAAIDLAVSTNVTNGAVTKAGPGTMQFAGAQANTYAGATLVSDGTLSLAKSASTASIASSPVTIGDGSGTAASAILRIDANEQIVDTVAIALGGSDGQLFSSSGTTETILPLAVDFKGGDVRVAGTLTTTGNYVQGPGVAGTTTLAGGTLRAVSTGLGNYVLNQGTLQGTGSIVVTTLSNFATIDPGIGSTSAGQISVFGNIDLQTGSVVNLHVGGNLPGQFDELNARLNTGITPAAINVTNGTVQFRGTLNTGAIGAYIPPVGSFYDVMNFETRMLDTVGLNHLRLPSDFGTKNLGGAPWFDASFLSATNQLNAESYNSTTFGLLGNPPPSLGLAKKLRLSTLAAGPSLANDKTASTLLTKGGFTTNSTIRHQNQYVTVKNNSLVPITGPIYLEVTPSLAGVRLYNRAGVTLTSPGGKDYLVVTMSGLAAGASVTVQLDWLNPNLLTFTYTHRVLAGGLP